MAVFVARHVLALAAAALGPAAAACEVSLPWEAGPAPRQAVQAATSAPQESPPPPPVTKAPEPEPEPEPKAKPEPAPPPPPPEVASGTFRAVPEGLRDAVSGSVRVRPIEGGVVVFVETVGLPPGPKAVHIHEIPNCSDPTAGSMGGHFAPEAQPHGLPDSANHHRGDLGNLAVNQDGLGSMQRTVPRLTLDRDDPRSVLERAVVIRSRPEDGLGLDLGKPLACAVIRGKPDASPGIGSPVRPTTSPSPSPSPSPPL